MTINEQTGPDPANKLERGRSDPTRSTRLREARRLTGPLVEPLLQFIERVPRDLDSLKARSKAAYKKAVEIVADVGLEVRQRGLKYTVTEVAKLGVGVRIDVELGAALLRRRPKGLLPAARQELLDPSKAWWGGRRGRLADRPRYSISVSLGVVPRWYSRVVEVPVRIEVAAGFVAPGASEPPRLQPSWPPGGSRPAHG